MFNDLPILDSPDGSEYVVVEKDGTAYRTPMYKVLLVPTPSVAATPTAFTAVAFDNSRIDLAWSGVAANYIVERCRNNDGAWIEIYNGASTSFSDTDLYEQEHYYYRLKGQEVSKFDSEWAFADETTPIAP